MIFGPMSVFANLKMGAYLRKDKPAIARDLESLYGHFPILRERSGQRAGTLSGRERGILAIARALMARPRLLLMDEPSMGVAPLVLEEIQQAIRDIEKRGISMVLVEQNSRMAFMLAKRACVFGGNSALAGGIFAADSPFQRRMMIEAPKELLFKRAMDYSHWKSDPEIVRASVYKSGDTVRWLEEKGLRFEWIPPLFPNQVPQVLHWPEGKGAAIVKLLVNNCRELGVERYDQTAAKKIRIDDKGNVSGILADRLNEEMSVQANAVVIATGGYAGNRELMERYASYSENRELTAIPHTGDGLRMCIEIGAATKGLGLLLLGGPRVRGSFLLSAVAAEPLVVMVNNRGERFSDENIPCHFERGNTVDREPDKMSYAIFDTEIKEAIAQEGLKRPGWGLEREVVYFQPEVHPEKFEKELQAAAARGDAKIADSWEAIAEWMGAAPQTLRGIIETYNTACDRGLDRMFVKDPRYLKPP